MSNGQTISGGTHPTLDNDTLSSLWDGLSDHLIAEFWEIAKIGDGYDARWGRIDGKTDPKVVRAPLSDVTMEVSLNWQSPFESSGPECKAPALTAMLQSGTLLPIVDAISEAAGIKDKDSLAGKIFSFLDAEEAVRKSNDFLKQFEGRTGITKLNSTQVFTGMPPLKIQATAIFRAWRDTLTEVEMPFAKLMEWALPIELSKDGSIVARLLDKGRGMVESLMPSVSPTRIAMKYKNRLFSPLVIESITHPLQSDVDSNGRYVQLAIPMTLCSLTAIDRADWREWGGHAL